MALRVWLPLNNDLRQQGLKPGAATTVGTVALDANGKLGSCHVVNGSRIVIPIETVNDLPQGHEMSVTCWFNIVAWKGSYDCLWHLGNGNGGWTANRFTLWQNNTTHKLILTLSDGSTANNANACTTTTFEAGTWYHIACTYKSGTLKIYVNGVLESTTTPAMQPKLTNITAFNLGGTGASYYSNAKLNDFRMYDHCLSAKEVKELSKGLVVHYMLNEAYKLPNGYSALAYIENVGTPYINSGVALTINQFLEFDYFYHSTGSSNSFGIIGNGNWQAATYLTEMLASRQIKWHGVGQYVFPTIWDNNSFHHCVLYGGGKMVIDGVEYGTNATSGSLASETIIFFAAAPSSRPTPDGQRFYNFKITTENVLVRNFVPAKRNSDNVVGMYDTVTNTFYTNANSSGSFIAGPVIPPFTNMAYDSSGYNRNAQFTCRVSCASLSPRYLVATHIDASNGGSIQSIDDWPIQNDAVTITCWVKVDKSRAQVLWATPAIVCGTYPSYGGFMCNPVSAPLFDMASLVTNQWNHIVTIRDNNTYKMYVNGVEINTINQNNYYVHNSTKISIGNRVYNNSFNSIGDYVDFRVYATILSTTDILELYQTSMEIDSNGNILPRVLTS